MDATQPNSPPQPHGDFASGSVDNPSDRTASSQNQANLNAKLRKRTKTGCLTCRKRRIKCGEEKPICNNCIKSKRQCEGYNPRVIWKPPIGDWPGHPSVAGTLPYHTGVIPGARPSDFQQYRPPGALNVGSHAPIQPRPAVGQFDFANLESGQIPILTPVSPQTPQQYQHQQYQQPSHPQPFHAHQHPGINYQQQTGDFSLQPSPQFHPPQYQYSPDAHPFTTGAQTQAPFQAPFQYQPTSSEYNQPAQQVPHSSPHEFRDQTQQYTQTPTTQQPTYSQFRTPETPQEQYHLQQAPSYQHNPSISSDSNAHLPPQGPSNDHQSHFSYSASYPENEPYTPAAVLAQKAHLLPRFGSLDGGHGALDPEDFDVKPSLEQVFEPQPTRSQVDTQALEAQLMTVDHDRERLSPTEMLNKAAVEYHDDDYYDVESDEDIEGAPEQTSFDSPKFQRDFTLIMRLYNKHTSDLAIRRMDAFIYEGILDHYHAEWVANPLKNEHTARVFAHFIHSSAPMLSIHERNPLNTQSMFSKAPVPVSQQSLWTYTLPMMALSNQGLLHAMLAIGSLHIARLQGASITPSFKHYAYALKRIHHSVGHPMKRLQVTTLAASLLLGFYELMTADHLKWSSHLVGAKQLLVEIDYRGMTQSAKAMKAEQADFDKHLRWDDLSFPPKPRPHASIFRSEMPLPNEEILSTIIGKKLRYDELGHVIGDFDAPYPGSIPSSLDMTKFELFQDLFWWYCRQDAYQSIISGNRLLMDYNRWGDCPPRAPLGRSEAAYATHDHFILMLGRIADFAARDRVRKVKVVESQGGAWKPDPRMFATLMGRPAGGPPSMSPSGPPPGFGMPPSGGASMGPPPSPGYGSGPPSGYPMASQIASSMGVPQTPISPFSPQGSQGSLGPPGSQQPPPGFPSGPMQPPTPNSAQFPAKPPASAPPKIPFYGMAPSSSRIYMPSSYAKDRKLSPEMKAEEIEDLDQALQSALDEWHQINAALNVFASNLGPQFQPLSEEYYQPLSTPFGDAAQYRSYDISNIWALYNMAKIIVIRSHPCMPPAAMMAAGVAAPMTAGLANEIGRIAAGMVGPQSHGPLTPSFGAALISSTMPLFFAGVQYTDAAQRAWLIPRILDIEARTGFASAGLIAKGCEVSWERAAEAGRGPPYTARRERESADSRKSGRVVEDLTPVSEFKVGGYVPLRDHSGESRYVHQSEEAGRLHWAMGLLADGQTLSASDRRGT